MVVVAFMGGKNVVGRTLEDVRRFLKLQYN